MGVAEEPILSRLDRLDNMLRQLEEINGGNRSPKSSWSSSGTLTSDGCREFSSKSLEKRCRPIEYVIMEAESKGSLVERLDGVEDRMSKMESERKKEELNSHHHERKGLKQLVRQCVKGNGNAKKHKPKA